MNDYAQLISEAEKLRMTDHPKEAIEKYRSALAIGGPHDRHARHMFGVSLLDDDDLDEALAEFDRALEGASDIERSEILRDRARALDKLDRTDEAKTDFEESLRLAPIQHYPAQAAAALYLYGRHQLRHEQLEALRNLAVADAVLQTTDSRPVELYCAIWYAYALIQAGRPDEAKAVAERALKLAPKFGSENHLKRAQFLVDHAADPAAVKDEIKP